MARLDLPSIRWDANAAPAVLAPRWIRWPLRLLTVLLNRVQQSCVLPMKVRARILNLMGNRLSRETYLAERVFITGCGLTTEGNVSINAGSHIDAAASIFLGDGVRIACGVMITTTTHLAGPPDLRAGETIRRSVSIGSGTWVGARAIILPGVNIASGCIIGAGAVVAADTLPDGLYVGVPARRIKDLALS